MGPNPIPNMGKKVRYSLINKLRLYGRACSVRALKDEVVPNSYTHEKLLIAFVEMVLVAFLFSCFAGIGHPSR